MRPAPDAESDKVKLARIEADKTKVIARSQIFITLGSKFIKSIGFVLVAYYIYLSIDSIAGKNTVLNIYAKLLAHISIIEKFSYVAGGGGICYGLYQRKMRRNEVKRLSDRNKGLERKFDKGRTSSNLTADGNTPPEDLI